MKTAIAVFGVGVDRDHTSAGRDLSAGRYRCRAGVFKDKANGQIVYRNGRGDRFADYCPAVYLGQVFPSSAVGCWEWIRRRQLRRHKLRTYKSEAH